MEITAFGMTDVGQVRSHNEDSILLAAELNLFAVADGMGGHRGGEVASKMMLEMLQDYMSKALNGMVPRVGESDPLLSDAGNLLVSGVRFANRAVFEASQAKSEWRGMGTTIVAVLMDGRRAVIAHVGDSRAYLLRGKDLIQLTKDHSWIEEQVRAGLMSRDEALVAVGRNMLTRAIGQEEMVQVDIDELELKGGDYLMLCSDGLFGMVSDEEIAALIKAYPMPEDACRELVSYANGRGGRDNISVVMIATKGETGVLSGVKRFFSKG